MEVQSALNQKGLEFMGVGSVKDVWFVNFSICRGLLWGGQAFGQQHDCSGQVGRLCSIGIDLQTH